ncbi:MAG: bifunctional glycoside hydrolase 114/ polysaccharide deacetylase family protein [Methylococcales bacterium]|nr:bifunctional glycoside hydrolase 114/ polysaccharide deacetylase family protein [Methylococcales bacterium]
MLANLSIKIDFKINASRGLLFWFFFLLSPGVISAELNAETAPSTAFYYAQKLPVELLSTYQRVVVEPDNVTSAELAYLKKRGVRVYAYFSIGEVGPARSWLSEIEPAWILGTNAGWKSTVMDMTQPGWRRYAIEKQMQALKERGFDNFFLDTMDSYQLFAKTPEAQQQQQQGMITLVRGIKQHFGEVHLLFNRGFEIVDSVATLCDGVVAESLFKGWDPGKSAYKEVNENDRTWLFNKLKTVQQQYKLPIIVLDYLPPKERADAEKTAEKIKALGFVPWISTPALDYMGVGMLNLIPRKVLLLYDSKENSLPYSNAHRFIATPLEYLGYSPEYLDISAPLPDFILKGRYAGIVAWTSAANASEQQRYAAWILKQIQEGVKVAFMNAFPFINNAEIKQALNLDASAAMLQEPINVDIRSPHVGYEVAPLKRRLDLLTVEPHSERNSWIRVTSATPVVSEPVYTAAWGGMALSPYLFVETVENESSGETLSRWIIDPFVFLAQALQLPELPVADNTTENGRRILTAHIDGDGFYDKTEVHKDQYSPEVIMQDFIVDSQWPHTVSVIEGEISAQGLKPGLSEPLEHIARKLFSLPNVEIASHSYSHPFFWLKAAESVKPAYDRYQLSKELQIDSEERYTLPIPNYQFNVEREVVGSINYINNRLAPVHKKTKVFLWTGDSLPNEDATRNGLLSLMNISPSGVVQGTHFQPYAPIQNENRYTNNWLGPFYGYQNVIETFKLTDMPNRFKPISIYYHFYSGDKIASVRALQRVYAWAKTQQTLPLWISEYTPRLYAFRHAVYEKRPNGWKIHHAQNIKTLRLPSNAKPPNVSASKGVVGYKAMPQGLYVSLLGEDTIELDDSTVAEFPYVDNSNAQIESWQKANKKLHFRLKGHQPVTVAFAHFTDDCTLKSADNKILHGSLSSGLYTFNFNNNDTGALDLTCE